MRREHGEIGGERNDSGREVEDQEKTEQSGRPESLPPAPQIACKGEGEEASHEIVESARQAQRPSGARAPGEVERRQKRRLIEPDVAVKRLAELHLPGGGHGQIFFRPQDVHVAQARGKEDEKQRREECARAHDRFH
jgi:hypothetical protein